MSNRIKLAVGLGLLCFLSGLVWARPDVDVVTPDSPVVIDLPKVSLPYTAEQHRLLVIAKEEGDLVGWPETIQAIILQESSAGAQGPVGDLHEAFGERSYCHMQIKLTAARDVLRHYNLGDFDTDEELLAKLLTDDRFCIRMGAHYFRLMMSQTDSWRSAVVAYNQGLRGSRVYGDRGGYLEKIQGRIYNDIRPYKEWLGYGVDLQLASN